MDTYHIRDDSVFDEYVVDLIEERVNQLNQVDRLSISQYERGYLAALRHLRQVHKKILKYNIVHADDIRLLGIRGVEGDNL